ncbi:Oidioi.mRNA.OKI2018_I69.chr1.g820.t1.cds [Oikopleura dioica]|uniref:Oidioi.mRNA.OKI2018_I69.chr1.g820.t1.cds n=1 Tax=Oikopleura dioica TaxID=34765 RepID=A0ABN7SQA4_OIKDI|nr:Oidioi.mRNA.OKI2018_I69.chr1.g820.t1.cds [Oikopleura dioica]
MKALTLFPIIISAWNLPPGWVERKNEFMRRVNGEDPMGWWMKPASFPLQEDKHAELKQEAGKRLEIYDAIDFIKDTEIVKELDETYPIGPIVDIIDDAVVFPREENEESSAILPTTGFLHIMTLALIVLLK